jgi:hypothetical protein
VLCIFGSCHERPWGALALIDRRKGVDGMEPLVEIWPKSSRKLVGNGNLDSFKKIENFYEDPWPLDENNFLVVRTIVNQSKTGIYLVGRDGLEELVLEGTKSLFDPQILAPRPKPNRLPVTRNFNDENGTFYVHDVYEGTHMKGVEKGVVKYLRVVESPEKRTWTRAAWGGEGEQAPALNWHSFENKRILGETPVEEDGSANFVVPAGKYVYFQLLDKDKKMVQTMRSGTMLMPGEVNGCVGCHENRIAAPHLPGKTPLALKKAPRRLEKWMDKEPFKFSFMEHVQPVLDKHCVSCHDFDPKNRKKLVLARDMNPFFNAAYVNLYVKKSVKLIGGGPAAIQQPYSWGSHASKLTKIIDGKHGGIKLTQREREVLYTWMDLNGVYYPVYESAFDTTLAGRSPLENAEINELNKLTGVNIGHLNSHRRRLTAQISFDRPEASPCLDGIRGDKGKFDRAVALIRKGGERLKKTPRGDIESEIVVAERLQAQLRKYDLLEKDRRANNESIAEGKKYYDPKP